MMTCLQSTVDDVAISSMDRWTDGQKERFLMWLLCLKNVKIRNPITKTNSLIKWQVIWHLKIEMASHFAKTLIELVLIQQKSNYNSLR